jgi:hypothetical protein
MRIGTFSCWLFGHKFLWRGAIPQEQVGLNSGQEIITTKKMNFCMRCGCPRDSLT